jgi:hypothetical protein
MFPQAWLQYNFKAGRDRYPGHELVCFAEKTIG